MPKKPKTSIAPVATKLPASCELTADVHAAVGAAAKANFRSFAKQLALIATDWAAKNPANQPVEV